MASPSDGGAVEFERSGEIGKSDVLKGHDVRAMFQLGLTTGNNA